MSAPKGKWTWKGLELLGSHWHPIIKTSLRDAIPAPHSVLPRSSRVILMNSHRPPNASVCCIRTACSETLLRTLTCHHLLSAGLLLVMSINSSPAKKGGEESGYHQVVNIQSALPSTSFGQL